MKTLKPLLLSCAALTLTALGLSAADSGSDVNPAGTWKWTFETQGGQTIESSVKLKLEGDKLTGTFMGRGGTEVDIQVAPGRHASLTLMLCLITCTRARLNWWARTFCLQR